ncbi:Endonuclease/exonuclease/phosphatase, partial [Mycena amicta]
MRKRLKIFNSPYPENPSGAKGIAIVLNRELTNIEGVKIRYLIPGKAILATIPWHKKATITVLGIYAPTESAEVKCAFWEELTEMWIDPERDMPAVDWLGGDFNLVVNPNNRLPQHADDPKAVAALERFMHILNLEDGWRRTNPTAKAYTYTSTQTPPTHSRIDRICVPRNHFNRYRGWSIDDSGGELSDHKMVSVTVRTPGAPYVGKGRYTIPLHILHDRGFRNYAVEEGAKLAEDIEKERNEENNPQILFRDYKEKILKFARERAKESI